MADLSALYRYLQNSGPGQAAPGGDVNGVPVVTGGTPDPRGTVTVANGRSVLMNPVTGDIIRDLGPAPVTAGQRSLADELAIASAPHYNYSSSNSSSTSENFQHADPAQLAQEKAIADAQLAQTAQKNAADIALQRQTLAFSQQKESFAESQDNKRLAMEANQQAQDNKIKLATLEQQRQQINSEMQFRAQQANIQFQNDAANRLQKNYEDIGQFAGNPTDYGKLAGYLTAHQMFGGAATGLQGQNFTSPQSLQPLGGALTAAQTNLAQTTQNPFGFTPLAANPTNENPNDFYTGPRTIQGNANIPAQGSTAAIDTSQNNPNFAGALLGGGQNAQTALAALTAQGFTPADTTGATAPNSVPQAKNGGVESQAYISGEKGPEINIPLPNGKALVLNEEQAASAGINLKRLMKMAQGGIFDNGTITDLSQQTTDPQQFLDTAFAKAIGGTPWGSGGKAGLPSPVYASSPGVSPLVTQLLGAIGQTGGLLPASEYQRQADLISPVAYTRLPIARQIPVGRTA